MDVSTQIADLTAKQKAEIREYYGHGNTDPRTHKTVKVRLRTVVTHIGPKTYRTAQVEMNRGEGWIYVRELGDAIRDMEF